VAFSVSLQANTVQGVVICERTQLNSQYFPALQKFIVLELGLTLVPISKQTEAAGFLCELVCELIDNRDA
jgi:hypothetical protein